MLSGLRWKVYLLECRDGTYYCGATNDLAKRLDAHNKGKGAKYTRGRLPVRLRAISNDMSKSQALKLECRVKKLPRARKLAVLKVPVCQHCGHPVQ